MTRSAESHLSVAHTADALSALRAPDCPALIWRRRAAPAFQRWIDARPPETLPRVRTILRPDAVRTTLGDLFLASGLPKGAERDTLLNEIAALSDAFAALMGARWLRLRLDVVTNNACRRFHTDAVTARLVCTFRGPGTQYGIAPDGHDPAEIRTVPTGDPILLRGTLWPTREETGFRHRSPPIEGSGKSRLVLVLDPIDDPGAEL